MMLEPFLRKSLDLPSLSCPNPGLLAKLYKLAREGIPAN